MALRYSIARVNQDQVESARIYIGEPLQSNLLSIGANSFVIGMLEAGKYYTLVFSVKVTAPVGEKLGGKFVFEAKLDNAGTKILDIDFS